MGPRGTSFCLAAVKSLSPDSSAFCPDRDGLIAVSLL